MDQDTTLDPGTLSVLIDNFSGSPDVLKAVFDDFHESVARLHARIRTAIDTTNTVEMARAAHSLKSNAATIGALGMATEMREIEKAGIDGTTDGCAERLERSEAIYKVLIPIIDGVVDIAGGSL